jgi:hypothetical protein
LATGQAPARRQSIHATERASQLQTVPLPAEQLLDPPISHWQQGVESAFANWPARDGLSPQEDQEDDGLLDDELIFLLCQG